MLNTAIELARANPVRGLPQMGAVIARRRKVVSVGLNSRKTDPLQQRYTRHPLAVCKHAEIDAIKNATKKGEDIAGATMYVARLLRNGKVALAEPCEGCKRALEAHGIRRVFWTMD